MGGGGAGADAPEQYPPFTPKTTPSGDILFTTRTVDPVAAAAEARRSGLWASTEITDTLWPARDARTRPLMPLRRGHMAMLVTAGFLDNLCLEANGRRILVKGRTSKEMVMVEDSPEKEVHREKLKTTVVALVLQRQFREGCGVMPAWRRGAWHGSVWPVRYCPAYPQATAATRLARTVPGAAFPAPPGRPAAS